MSVGAVVACCALAVACTPEQSASAPSPKPASTKPTESQIERQMRLDYEAAEKAYRANMAEQDRQSQLGITEKTRRGSPRRPQGTICDLCSKFCVTFAARTGTPREPQLSVALCQMDGRRINFN